MSDQYGDRGYRDHEYGESVGTDDDPTAAGYRPPPAADGYDESDFAAAGPSSAGRGGGRHRRASEPRHHPVLIGLAIFVVVAVVVVGGLVWWAKNQIRPGGKPGPLVTVVIPRGASSHQIGSILSADGVIHSGFLFPYYAKVKGASTMYPGTYRLAKNESYASALTAIETGPPIVRDRLVVPEGFTLGQIAAAVAKLPDVRVSAAQFEAAASGQVRSPYEPAGAHDLEGLLFPATYEVTSGTSASALVQQMVDAFDTNANQAGLAAGAARLAMTPYQLVTVASMVEREAKRPQDRGPIASVIYNRLKGGMPLGIDATLLYGLHTNNAAVDPQTPSPYNTRLHTGLPPTPIANPGLASLAAAINPPATTYLYYAVTGPGGQTSFASSSSAFTEIEAKCRAQGYCS
ncbi:MAG TPA: endolytic transglycosylase MltG [Acidimicrobiales bacterium]|jgi:UPF0755 protein|nr:endolytic transglycosylase MltG [Acidimicrobiales bacterium]